MKKLLVNANEEHTFQRLRDITSNQDVTIHSKIALKEIVDFEQLEATDREYCWKAHLDFLVVSEDYFPLFAVEFDGPSHRQDKRTRERTPVRTGYVKHPVYLFCVLKARI